MINYQSIAIYFFYFTKMSSTLNDDLNDTHVENGDGFMGKIKEFKKNHSVLFYMVIIFVVVALIGIIVAIVYVVNKKKKEESKEGYSASNEINDEFDYVNSVIYSTLGDVSELEKINSAAVLV